MAKLLFLIGLCFIIMKIVDTISYTLFGEINTPDGVYAILLFCIPGMFLTMDAKLTMMVCILPVLAITIVVTKFFIKFCYRLAKHTKDI